MNSMQKEYDPFAVHSNVSAHFYQSLMSIMMNIYDNKFLKINSKKFKKTVYQEIWSSSERTSEFLDQIFL